MLEICFDDLFGERLKIINMRKKRKGKPSNDVFPVDFRLDCGYLTDGVFSEDRFKYLKALSQDEWMGDEAFYTEENWESFKIALNTIKDRANTGEEIVFWISLNPKAVCDFLFLISEINTFENISIINYNENEITRFYEPEYEKLQATKIELNENNFKLATESWKRIYTSSGILRVLVDGSIVSAPEDFYDELILKNLPEGEFTALELRWQLEDVCFGTEDFMIKRICKILRSDKVEILGWKPVIQSPLDLYEQIYKKKSS